MKCRVIRRALPLGIFCLSVAAISQGLPEINQKIIEEGQKHNQARLTIRHLTKKIGPRLLGSKNLDKACKWAIKKFKDWGLTNVHFEPYLEIPVPFNRGKKQIGRMVSPVARDFQWTTPAWSAGTQGNVKGLAIDEPMTEEEIEKAKTSLKGAWVLASGAGLSIRSRLDETKLAMRGKIEACGIAGWIYASANEFVTTNGSYKATTKDDLARPPRITVRDSDMKAIREGMANGKPVELEFNIDNQFETKPRQVGNVIAEIKGTEKPDEVVIIGAHLDSWDGPGSEGACDNGTGSTAILEAARILGKYEVKPKRTIRFILFTGEEEGLLGSQAYVKEHAKEVGNISAIFVDDSGTNYDSGLACTDLAFPLLEKASAPLKDTDAKFEFKITVINPSPNRTGRGGGGSDHASFAAVGVPAYFMRKTGTANYMEIWHTQNDNLEHVNLESLSRSALVLAVLSYNLACSDVQVPRVVRKENP